MQNKSFTELPAPQRVHEETRHNGGLFHCKHCKQWLYFPDEIGKSCPGPRSSKLANEERQAVMELRAKLSQP